MDVVGVYFTSVVEFLLPIFPLVDRAGVHEQSSIRLEPVVGDSLEKCLSDGQEGYMTLCVPDTGVSAHFFLHSGNFHEGSVPGVEIDFGQNCQKDLNRIICNRFNKDPKGAPFFSAADLDSRLVGFLNPAFLVDLCSVLENIRIFLIDSLDQDLEFLDFGFLK